MKTIFRVLCIIILINFSVKSQDNYFADRSQIVSNHFISTNEMMLLIQDSIVFLGQMAT
jgi:hypothetical protein